MIRRKKIFELDGQKYTVQEPTARPNIMALEKKGVVAHINFSQDGEWVRALTKKWAVNPSYQKPTKDLITGLLLSNGFSNVLVKVTKLSPYAKQTYQLDCYEVGSKSNACQLQIIVNVSGAEEKHIITGAMGAVNSEERIRQIQVAADMTAKMFIGVKTYIHVVNFSVYDEASNTYGPGRVTVEPLVINGIDVLLK